MLKMGIALNSEAVCELSTPIETRPRPQMSAASARSATIAVGKTTDRPANVAAWAWRYGSTLWTNVGCDDGLILHAVASRDG